jgi:hypothetical protein
MDEHGRAVLVREENKMKLRLKDCLLFNQLS